MWVCAVLCVGLLELLERLVFPFFSIPSDGIYHQVRKETCKFVNRPKTPLSEGGRSSVPKFEKQPSAVVATSRSKNHIYIK